MNRRKAKPRHPCEMCGEGDFSAKRKFCPACSRKRARAHQLKALAKHRRTKPKSKQAAMRSCLSCNKMFKSTGPWHRRCDPCDEKLDKERVPLQREGGVVCHSTAGHTTQGGFH